MVQALRRQGREKRRNRQRRHGGGKPMKAAILSRMLLAGLLAGLLAAPAARAEDAPPACEVPSYLLTSDSTLAKVTTAVKDGKALNVLVVGSRSSTSPAQEASAYPARLLAMLKEKLGSVPVNLSVEIQSGKTAEETAGTLAKLVEAKNPTLVIWQTGTYDAIRGVDPDDFRNAVDEGVTALQ